MVVLVVALGVRGVPAVGGCADFFEPEAFLPFALSFATAGEVQ